MTLPYSEPASLSLTRAHGWKAATLLIGLACALLFSGCAVQKGNVFGRCLKIDGLEEDSVTGSTGFNLSDRLGRPEHTNLTQKILATAYSQFGKAYKYGGRSPKTGFDCSGLVQWAYGQHGINLPRETKSLIHHGAEVKIKDIRPGDLLLFRGYRSRTGRHVGIYAGNGVFIHSPHTGDRIKESKTFGKHYKERFITARRVMDDVFAAPLPEKRKQAIIEKALAVNMTFEPEGDAKKTAASTKKKRTARKKYRIKHGDTIWVLARRFGVSPKNLLRANNLTARHTLRIGQTLAIP